MKLTKADIDKVRHIEGYPIANDEDIIALSNPPYYTACPNPFIEDFIKENGIPYDEETDDYKVYPFTKDVSENKHDLIYNIHTYHTKVPPKAIVNYIEHYTKPGDLVLDCFCGSGMTGIAAQISQSKAHGQDKSRSAILIDLSPYATFISSNYNNPNAPNLISEIEADINSIKKEYDYLYRTRTEDVGLANENIFGTINYTVWSDVYYCPNCKNELVYYDVAIDPDTKKTLDKFNCPSCNVTLERKQLIQKTDSYYDKFSGEVSTRQSRVPVLINYTFNKKRHFKTPDLDDIKAIQNIEANNLNDIPIDNIIDGDETHRLFKSGVKKVKDLYVDRTLVLLSALKERFNGNNKKLFLFTSCLAKLTMLNRYMPNHGSRALVGPMVGTYYLPPISVENNVIKQFEFQLKKLRNLYYQKGNTIISTQSATNLSNISDNTIDLVFIDPPFGSNIMYSELNFIAESWLKIHTRNNSEAIMNKSQRKGLYEYKKLMLDSFKELYRIIKPNRWIVIEYHNSKNAIWNIIQEVINESGFVIADVRVLDKSKKTVIQYNSYGSVNKDLIITAYKPDSNLGKAILMHTGTEETAWDFVKEHLSKLKPCIKDGDVVRPVREREPELLFDRMVAYHVMSNISVPINAADFYLGLEQKFIKRDGMFFLHDQINEYDDARIKAQFVPMQLTFIVSDEKSSIAWLYQQLVVPQTYGEIQPQFIKELHQEKHEELPELMTMLEENFLQDEDGKWYIPDITKEGDLIKLREKRLLKDFEEYLTGKGKLKTFRTEAVRAGFAKLWKDKNYKDIVRVAERLPETVIQEDDKLLMYYDISLSRME